MATSSSTLSGTRSRADLCPGVFRPWSAADGALVRLRLIGGRLSPESLTAISEVAAAYGDGDVHLTRRANLQLRGLPSDGSSAGDLPEEVVEAIAATGLLPSRTHELVRNVMVSPQSGLSGGHADLRPVAAELDERLCADPRLAQLPGRFLFVLDDGRGDLVGRSTDLGLVAVDSGKAQLRIGSTGFGAVLPLTDAPAALVALAADFLAARGTGAEAPWHVDELPRPLAAPVDRVLDTTAPPLPQGPVPGGVHVPAPGGIVDQTLARHLAESGRGPDHRWSSSAEGPDHRWSSSEERAASRDHPPTPTLVVTPWHGVLVAQEEAR